MRGRRRIGEVLVEHGLLTPDQLRQALAAQAPLAPGQPRRRLGTVVIEAGFATDAEVAQALAEAHGLSLVDLGRRVPDPEAARLLPRAVAERAGVLLLALEDDGARATLATADPTNVIALDDVKLHTGASELVVLVAPESQVRDSLARAWSLSEDSSDVSTLFESMDTPDPDVEPVPLETVESAPTASRCWGGPGSPRTSRSC